MDQLLQDDAEPDGDAPPFRRLLRLAGARPDQRVCVAGAGGLEPLLQLCRLGYAQACCVSGTDCGCAGEAPCDMLLLAGPIAPDALASALRRLKPGGVLAAVEAGLDDDAVIERALAEVGRTAGWRVHDMAQRCLVALEVLPAPAWSVARAA